MSETPFTYRKLLEQLKTLSDEQLENFVTIRIGNEPYYYGKLRFADAVDDILEPNHPYFSRYY